MREVHNINLTSLQSLVREKPVWYLAESPTGAMLIRIVLNRGVTYTEVRKKIDEHNDLPREPYQNHYNRMETAVLSSCSQDACCDPTS